MSAVRDSLPPEQRAWFDADTKRAAAVLAEWRGKCAEAVREGGPAAVGALAKNPADNPAEITAAYAELQKRVARREQAHSLAPTGT